jgi:cytochrome P450
MTQFDMRTTLEAHGRDSLFAALHRDAPLYKSEGGAWIASRFEDVREILLDHARFSSSAMGGRTGFALPLLTDDPPRHATLRSLLAKAFTPAAMDAMRGFIEDLAEALADNIPRGKDVDIVAALTIPLPMAVIASMMGIPRERSADFKRWSNALIGIQESVPGADRIASLMEMRRFFLDVAEKRRAKPGADLVSALTRAQEASDVLNDEQVGAFCMLLMLAGNETTTNLLGNLLERLSHKPETWAQLRADPGRIEAVVEESLRVDSPVQMIVRRVREDTTIGSVAIPRNDFLIVYLGSANRDPGRWNAPENFELARIRERHVAFGHGVHTCIGAPLARLEAQAAMAALVRRFEHVAPGTNAGQRTASELLYGFSTLPLVFS